ncbi:unnamed protein product [Symbiodinium sp. CCMP2456]|nr:unnamed protein product [Symbiodinium sp. CCMP2456]
MQSSRRTGSDRTAALSNLTVFTGPLTAPVRGLELRLSAHSSTLLRPLEAPAVHLYRSGERFCISYAIPRIFGHQEVLDEPGPRFLTDWSLVCVFRRRIRFATLRASCGVVRHRLLLSVPAALQLPANPDHVHQTLGFVLEIMQRCRFSRTAVQTPEPQLSARSVFLQQVNAPAVPLAAAHAAHHAPQLQLSACRSSAEATDAPQRLFSLSTRNDVIQAK